MHHSHGPKGRRHYCRTGIAGSCLEPEGFGLADEAAVYFIKEVHPMENLSIIQTQNQELARQINDEARTNPNSPYTGKFVGLANGKVVATADSLDEIVAELERTEADPQRTFCIEAGLDYEAAQAIWGAR